MHLTGTSEWSMNACKRCAANVSVGTLGVGHAHYRSSYSARGIWRGGPSEHTGATALSALK